MYSNNEIINGLIQNDMTLVKSIYKAQLPIVFGWVKKNNGSLDDAFDVFQEAFLIIISKLKSESMIEDLNKGFGTITYNFLNLQYVLTKDANNSITYHYDAQGTKVKQVKTEGGNATVRYYFNSFEYDNTKDLNIIHMGEGVINVRSSATVFQYEYFLKDHLGNTRISFEDNSGTPSLNESVDYYPFGLEFIPISQGGTNKYLI
jgi:hypothetical protein